ncbi:MAG: hypothetical protein ACLGIO_09410, partial [Acidimicrobiia bacterium]
MIRLDAATVLVQWATGGLLFLWVTTRRRQVGIGYGWLLRATYLAMALGSLAVARIVGPVPVRDAFAALMAAAAGGALVLSVVRRRAGVAGERARRRRRTARVAAMTGIERGARGPDASVPEFPPAADLVAPLLGVVACVAGGLDAGGPAALAVVRTLVGAAFLGAVTDAMLLGH